MSDPTTVTHAQVRAAYDALGLDADRWGDTCQVWFDIETGYLQVQRRPHPPAGGWIDKAIPIADPEETTDE
jgi:hypothetical protein